MLQMEELNTECNARDCFWSDVGPEISDESVAFRFTSDDPVYCDSRL